MPQTLQEFYDYNVKTQNKKSKKMIGKKSKSFTVSQPIPGKNNTNHEKNNGMAISQ